MAPERLESIAKIRLASDIQPDEGPSDEKISAAIDGFAHQFQYWYDRVMAEAVAKYRNNIIGRINPFVRGVEYRGHSPEAVARALVRDYGNRNFVTAGGWAIEKMAIALGQSNVKAASTGIDIERSIPDKNEHHLYVMKSGKVTRNSDILASLKTNARKAEKLLMQGGAMVKVWANYAISAGQQTTTFHDGIRRPSSADFWSEITGLPQGKAMRLAYEISRCAADGVAKDAAQHLAALETLVREYIAVPGDPHTVDWDFIFKRTMSDKPQWAAEDTKRHKAAMAKLLGGGYVLVKPASKPRKG